MPLRLVFLRILLAIPVFAVEQLPKAEFDQKLAAPLSSARKNGSLMFSFLGGRVLIRHED